MTIWTGILLLLNILFVLFGYFFSYRNRKQLSSHLRMNIARISGGGMATVVGILLINDFPVYYMGITIIATLTGMVIGSLFGGMFDHQTMLTGYITGLLSGIMAPMIGAAASYSLPFVVVMEIFIISSFILLLLSAKTSCKTTGER